MWERIVILIIGFSFMKMGGAKVSSAENSIAIHAGTLKDEELKENELFYKYLALGDFKKVSNLLCEKDLSVSLSEYKNFSDSEYFVQSYILYLLHEKNSACEENSNLFARISKELPTDVEKNINLCNQETQDFLRNSLAFGKGNLGYNISEQGQMKEGKYLLSDVLKQPEKYGFTQAKEIENKLFFENSEDKFDLLKEGPKDFIFVSQFDGVTSIRGNYAEGQSVLLLDKENSEVCLATTGKSYLFYDSLVGAYEPHIETEIRGNCNAEYVIASMNSLGKDTYEKLSFSVLNLNDEEKKEVLEYESYKLKTEKPDLLYLIGNGVDFTHFIYDGVENKSLENLVVDPKSVVYFRFNGNYYLFTFEFKPESGARRNALYQLTEKGIILVSKNFDYSN